MSAIVSKRVWLPSLLACAAAFTVGCTSEGDDTAIATTATESGDPSEAYILWGAATLQFRVSGGAGGFWLGLAETRDCGAECWTGEDCIFGYEAATGQPMPAYCHYAAVDGTDLLYGGDRESLQEGYTVFPDQFACGADRITNCEEHVTFFLESNPSYGGNGGCWVWGHAPSYYDGFGCTVMDW